MAQNKTQATDLNPIAFLNSIEHRQKRADSFVVLDIMKDLTDSEPVMWGSSIIGFGKYTFKYAGGGTGDWFLIGFSPRKQSLTLYFMSGFDNVQALLNKLGKHKTGKGCLYINKLSDVDMTVLKELIQTSITALCR